MAQEKPQIGWLFKQINEALERNANNAMRPYGVTLSQTHVLMKLHYSASGTQSFKQLEAALNVAQSTIWGLVNRLEAKGLVESVESPDDARAKLVHITAAGRQVCRTCQANIDDHERQLVSNLSREEATLLVDLLKRVHEAVAE